MNYINSVLMEGIIQDKPVISNSGELCTFTISNTEIIPTKDEKNPYRIKIHQFIIKIDTGIKIAKYASCLKKGIAVKIVGKLQQDSPNIFIKVDHIESTALRYGG